MGPFEIQVTVTDTSIGKMIFDRKVGESDINRVWLGIRSLAQDFVLNPQSDQSRQEVQYNETRPLPPTVTRDPDGRIFVPSNEPTIVVGSDVPDSELVPQEFVVPSIDERNRE